MVVNSAIALAAQAEPRALVRLRVRNACNVRFVRPSLDAGPLAAFSSDGGCFGAAEQTDTAVMFPGERYELLLDTRTRSHGGLRANLGERGPVGAVRRGDGPRLRRFETAAHRRPRLRRSDPANAGDAVRRRSVAGRGHPGLRSGPGRPAGKGERRVCRGFTMTSLHAAPAFARGTPCPHIAIGTHHDPKGRRNCLSRAALCGRTACRAAAPHRRRSAARHRELRASGAAFAYGCRVRARGGFAHMS